MQELKFGGKVKRRRREPSRGAKGAKGCGVWLGVSPSPQGERSPRNFFLRFWGQNDVFSWTPGAKFRFFFYDQNSIEIHLEYKDCRGD